MLKRPEKDRAKVWRVPELDDLELMKATFVHHVFPHHLHDTYVIGIIEKGEERFDCDGAEHRASTGSLIVVNPGAVHNGHAGLPGYYSMRTLYPTVSLMRAAVRGSGNGSDALPHFPSPVVTNRQVANELHLVHRMLETDGPSKRALRMMLDTLARLSHTHAIFETHNGNGTSRAVEKVKEYIREHYAENVSIEELSRVSGLSPYYLIHSFKKAVGLPPHKFLVNTRVEQARRLLGRGDPIAEVAYATGFADQSHLTRVFRGVVGVTPGRYAARV